jgi:periplasmic copper chaperone A
MTTLKKILIPTFMIMGIFTAITSACPPITVGNLSIVGHRWVRPTTGPNTAAYLTIKSSDGQSDKLIKVESEDANTVELHNNIEEDGVMKMRPVDFIEVGSEPVELKPGGLHIMLMGLKPSFQGKEKIPLKLTFEKAGEVTVNFSVKVPEANG